MSISVCMATYNGEPYVVRQLVSILAQLGPSDEVIVVDDCSTDGTVAAIERIGDARIKVHRNDRNRREVYSFSKAMQLARNDFVFLSDQDDLWVPGRAVRMIEALERSGASVVTTNFEWMDEHELPVSIPFDGVRAADSRRHARNIIDIFIGKTNYFGCAMAMRRDFVDVVCPIPAFVESHDLWIAQAANLRRANVHIDASTLRKRKHGGNATSTVSTRSLTKKLWSRVVFARSLLAIASRGGSLRTRSS